MIHSRCRRQNPLHSLYTSGNSDERPEIMEPRSQPFMMEEMEPVTGHRYDHVFKVVLVGESGIGKTSLAQRFSRDAYPAKAPPTIGVDFSVRVVISGNKRIKIQLWDTSGQEAMRSIVPNYFRFAEAIVLVYDCTDMVSFLKLPDWLSVLESFGEPNALKFIIGTKCDLETSRAVSPKMAKDFGKASNMPVFETSALTGDGVEEAFGSVVAALAKHFDVGEARSSLVLQGAGAGAGSTSLRGCC